MKLAKYRGIEKTTYTVFNIYSKYMYVHHDDDTMYNSKQTSVLKLTVITFILNLVTTQSIAIFPSLCVHY